MAATKAREFAWIPCKKDPKHCLAKAMTRTGDDADGTRVACTACGRRFRKSDLKSAWIEER